MLREVFEFWSLGRRRQWPAEKRWARQNRLFQRLVQAAAADVSITRELWADRGVRVENVRSLSDLPVLPVVRKRELIEYPLLARISRRWKLDQLEQVSTSGSTGIPFQIFFSRDEGARRRAVLYRALSDLGASPFDRRLQVKIARRRQWSQWQKRLHPYHWLTRISILEESVETFRNFRPQVINGLPTQLHAFALLVREREIHDIRPKIVILSGEMVLPETLRLLQETFPTARLASYYGTWEFGVVGTVCPTQGGYHLCTDNLILESVRDGRRVEDGESGEIVLTNLTSQAMPLIRYSTGDIGSVDPGPCSCGHPYPAIRDLQGRADDFLVHPDGHLIPPLQAVQPITRLEGLRQFRIIQETPERYSLEYEAVRDFGDEETEQIKDHFARVLGASRVSIKRVSALTPDKSGKLRKIISRVERGSSIGGGDEV